MKYLVQVTKNKLILKANLMWIEWDHQTLLAQTHLRISCKKVITEIVDKSHQLINHKNFTQAQKTKIFPTNTSAQIKA